MIQRIMKEDILVYVILDWIPYPSTLLITLAYHTMPQIQPTERGGFSGTHSDTTENWGWKQGEAIKRSTKICAYLSICTVAWRRVGPTILFSIPFSLTPQLKSLIHFSIIMAWCLDGWPMSLNIQKKRRRGSFREKWECEQARRWEQEVRAWEREREREWERERVREKEGKIELMQSSDAAHFLFWSWPCSWPCSRLLFFPQQSAGEVVWPNHLTLHSSVIDWLSCSLDCLNSMTKKNEYRFDNALW